MSRGPLRVSTTFDDVTVVVEARRPLPCSRVTAYDNALAESFIDSFKTELIADRVWRLGRSSSSQSWNTSAGSTTSGSTKRSAIGRPASLSGPNSHGRRSQNSPASPARPPMRSGNQLTRCPSKSARLTVEVAVRQAAVRIRTAQLIYGTAE